MGWAVVIPLLSRPPPGSEISLNGSSGFAGTLSLYPDSNGNLASTTFFARISAVATANVNGNLTITDAINSSLSKSIVVSGAVQSTTNYPPNAPTNISPLDGARGAPLSPMLQASAFSDPDSGDTQAASEWIVARNDDGSTVVDTGTDTSDFTTYTIPAANLAGNTQYIWRVRYEDNHGAWSSYSTPTSFTTANQPPTISSFTAAPNPVTAGATLTLSAAATDPGAMTKSCGRLPGNSSGFSDPVDEHDAVDHF